MKNHVKLKSLLDSAYLAFHSKVERDKDPVSFPHRYQNPSDQEIIGLFAALLAYGNVTSILNSVNKVIHPLGNNPKKAILELGNENPWAGFYHRFTTEEDLFILGHWIKKALESHGTLENFFIDQKNFENLSMKELLSSFVVRFTNQDLPRHVRILIPKRARNLKYLISDPMRGSACKRLNLYLRWMVRTNDGIDLGTWRKVSPNKLMLPIDTHLLKIIRRLRWTNSKTANWLAVEKSTNKLRMICAEDPVKYDFSLCHLSMRGAKL